MPRKDFEYRIHLFVDCNGFPYHVGPEERQLRMTTDLKKVTCGHCQGRVLQVIRDKPWDSVNVQEFEMLHGWATAAGANVDKL